MRNLYISGSPPTVPADGLSETNPWSMQQLRDYSPEPGDVVRLQGQAPFPIALEWFGRGDPDKPIELSSYGNGKARIMSQGWDSLNYSGPGGLVVRNLEFVGDGRTAGRSGVLIQGNGNGGPASNFRFEDLDCSGYGMGGLTISAGSPVLGVKILGGRYHGNAVGIHVSGGVIDNLSSRTVFGLSLQQVDASDNEWASGHGPFGISLNGVHGVEVIGCYCNRNGRTISGAGHGGLLLRLCTNVKVDSCDFIGNADPERGSDGQGCVLDGVQNALVAYNLSRDNLNGGFEIMDESDGEWNRDVTIRHNVSIGDNTGLMAFLHGGTNLRFEFNTVLNSLYKAVDLSGSGPDDKLVLLGNTILSPGLFAMEAELEHLQKCEWQGNVWPTDGQGFNVAGLGHFRDPRALLTALEGVTGV